MTDTPSPPDPEPPPNRDAEPLLVGLLYLVLALAAALMALPFLDVDAAKIAAGGGAAIFLVAALALWLRRREKAGSRRRRERLEGELRDASRRAKIADEQRRQFLTNMSHELRTPLAGILGLAEMLHRESLEEEQQGHVLLIQDSTRGLLTIVDDLLDIGKLGAGTIRLEARRVDVALLVEQTVSFLLPRAKAKGLEIRVELDPALPAGLQTDPTRLRQILVNLLSNAIKFTERGEIDVGLRWRGENSTLRLEVRDTGIGIPDTAISRLFSPFQQVDSSTSRRFGGTGLGLAICKSLAELMGGKIGVGSKRGEGSTFWLELPLRTAADDVEERAETPVTGEISGRRLLVVEDDEINRLVIVAKLEGLGAAVSTVGDGREALNRLGKERFDLVLMDCQIPDLDGYETTRRLRQSQGPNAGVPVIALTAHAHPEERTRCMEAGMNDFLSKPVETERLYLTLRDWLDLADSIREPSGVLTLGGPIA